MLCSGLVDWSKRNLGADYVIMNRRSQNRIAYASRWRGCPDPGRRWSGATVQAGPDVTASEGELSLVPVVQDQPPSSLRLMIPEVPGLSPNNRAPKLLSRLRVAHCPVQIGITLMITSRSQLIEESASWLQQSLLS